MIVILRGGVLAVVITVVALLVGENIPRIQAAFREARRWFEDRRDEARRHKAWLEERTEYPELREPPKPQIRRRDRR